MIFCVEDDSGIRDLMVYALNAAGLEAAGFDSGASLEDALRERRPSLILLDIMLPGRTRRISPSSWPRPRARNSTG